jgi:FkbH-like protein
MKEKIKALKAQIKAGEFCQAFDDLVAISDPMHDFTIQHKLARLMRLIPLNNLDLKPLKIALLATSTVDHLAEVLRFWLATAGFNAEFYFSEFNTVDQTILSPDSDLYKFQPEICWLFTSYRDIPYDTDLYGVSNEVVLEGVQQQVSRFENLWNAIQRHSIAHIVQNNADLPIDRSFGNYEGCQLWGRSNYYRLFNLELAKSCQAGATPFDLDFIASLFGRSHWFNSRFWYHSKHGFSLDATGLVAFHATRLIQGLKGRSKKCLVLDLDNTLWGGVIGDDGLENIKLGTDADGEAFQGFQDYILSLKQRGITLAVCSKNEDETARLPFLHHPEMRIQLDDISVFCANWNNKADNIQNIASRLEIGLDSMVFVDDNPAERDLVRRLVPEVAVPEMPGDPANYIRCLDQNLYFETSSFSAEDKNRAAMYRDNARRKDTQESFTSLDDFLGSLDMEATVGDFDSVNLPRICQLINKSNQFHLTTTRYCETQLSDFMKSSTNECRFFRLKDRFGDNGLISLIILEIQKTQLVIDTWVMSCRVLSRGMEDFVHNEILRLCQLHKCQRIVGKYIPTKKNKLVSSLYEKLGYKKEPSNQEMSHWILPVDQNTYPANTFIRCQLT